MLERHDINVVLVVKGLGRGGAERLVFLEALELLASGYAVEVWHQVDGEFRLELEDAGIRVTSIRPGTIRALLRTAQQRGPTIVHSHSPSTGAMVRLAASGLRGVRSLHTEHNLTTSYRPFTRILHAITSHRIDRLFAVSEAVLTSSPARAVGSSLLHLDCGTERMKACLQMEFRDAPARTVLCIASLTHKKDHANLIAAAAIAAGQRPEETVVQVVGDGPLRGELERAAADAVAASASLKVTFLGVRDDVPDLLADADVLVLPSTSEGLPLVILESLAASTPVIATSVGGVPEIIQDGENGVLVKSGDPNALASALLQTLENRDLRATLAMAGRSTVRSLCGTNWKQAYMNAIDDLARDVEFLSAT